MSIKYNGGYIPAVGADGTTLVANSASATGVAWAGPTFAAGKNKIINGDFGVWQRGTSFTPVANTELFSSDRWFCNRNGSGATVTVSQQTFSPGTAPVSGYESTYFLRYNQTVAGTGGTYQQIGTRIENVQTFAGQTVTLSFWAKADSARTITPDFYQYFGSGGSTAVDTTNGSITLTTSWVRYSITCAIPSISGKTLGTGNYLGVIFPLPYNTTFTFDIWGVQLEAGSVATPFTTATGTLSGELALCQRYLPVALTTVYDPVGGFSSSTTTGYFNIQFKVPARVAPTGISLSSASNFAVLNKTLTSGTPTAILFDSAGVNSAMITATTTAASPTILAGEGGILRSISVNGLILFTGCEL